MPGTVSFPQEPAAFPAVGRPVIVRRNREKSVSTSAAAGEMMCFA